MKNSSANRVRRSLFVNALLVAYGLILLVGPVRFLALFANGLWQFLLLGLFLAIAVFFCLAPRMLSFSARCRVALFTTSALVAIYAGEITLSALAPLFDPGEIRDQAIAARMARAHAEGAAFDGRSSLDVVLDLRRQGTLAYPSGSFETYLGYSDLWGQSSSLTSRRHSVIEINGEEVLPLGHMSNVVAVGLENENGYYSVFKTDEHGFRNPPGVWKWNDVDIVGVGDSFTEGCEVRDEESFVSLLRNEIPRTVNLGLGGGGPFTMLACLREYGRSLQPKVVLWCFYERNDLIDMPDRTNCRILVGYLEPSFTQRLLSRQSELDDALRMFMEQEVEQATRRKKLRKALSVACLQQTRRRMSQAKRNILSDDESGLGDRGAYFRPFSSRDVGPEVAFGGLVDDKHEAVFRMVLAAAKKEVDSWNGKLYFVYLPCWHRVANPHFASRTVIGGSESEDYRSRLLAMVTSMDIEIIDIAEAFVANEDPLSLFPFRLPGHYNPSGHRVAAAEILEHLVEDESGPLAGEHQQRTTSSGEESREREEAASSPGREQR